MAEQCTPMLSAKEIALSRLRRQQVRGLLSYTGSEADILSAGIIGRHMVPLKHSYAPILLFRYGQPWSGRCNDRGAVHVIRTIDGELAVLCFGARGETPSEMPPWSVTVAGNVVTLPGAANSPVKKMQRGRKVVSTAQESGVSIADAPAHLRLAWSAPT